MTLPWRQDPEALRGRETPAVSDDLGMIPLWSIVLAVIAFFLIEYLVHFVMPHPREGMMPMRVMFGYSSGTLIASYFLLMGYVSRDVKRRNMSAPLWMLIVILMPGGIGAVVYFLLRQPMMSRCPHCSTELASSYHFCPQCQFQMAPVCGQCFRGVEITDVYCKQCGHDLAEDQVPNRLRVYRD